MRSASMDVRRAASMWKVMMNPHDIEIEDIFNIFFDTMLGVTNVCYFKSQQLVFDRHTKEREINRALCQNRGKGS